VGQDSNAEWGVIKIVSDTGGVPVIYKHSECPDRSS
jgi:hypothetical protein